MRRGKGADTFTNFVRHRVSLKIGTLNIYFSFRFPLSTGFPVRAGARPPHHPAPGQFRHYSRDWWGDHTLSQQNFGLLSRNSLSESSASLSHCLPVCLSVSTADFYLAACQQTFYIIVFFLYVCLFICLSAWLLAFFSLSACMSLCLTLCLSLLIPFSDCMPLYPTVCFWFFLPFCPFSATLCLFLTFCLFGLSDCLPVGLSPVYSISLLSFLC